jgi:hypothetical protein
MLGSKNFDAFPKIREEIDKKHNSDSTQLISLIVDRDMYYWEHHFGEGEGIERYVKFDPDLQIKEFKHHNSNKKTSLFFQVNRICTRHDGETTYDVTFFGQNRGNQNITQNELFEILAQHGLFNSLGDEDYFHIILKRIQELNQDPEIKEYIKHLRSEK